ncbi:MAG: GerMN domain-containing protein [Candidatus Paceibacterota bacterium]
MDFQKRDIIIGIVFLLLASAVAFSFYLSEIGKEKIVPGQGTIQLYEIEGGQTVSSPLIIKGRITGGRWNGFEGQAGTVEMIGGDGTVLGSAILEASSDWMELPVEFEASLSFENPGGEGISLVFHNENPSGLPENSAVMSLPLKFGGEKSSVNVYFGKEGNSETCKEVFPLERNIAKTEAVARAAVEELLKGLTEEEKGAGYFTGINEGVKINRLSITDGIAEIDFDDSLERGVGGSCKVTFIREQITKTLMQFETVKKVIISINGRTEDILQP